MTTGAPRVAFGAPVYNRAEYLVPALESLLAQTYPDFALVVVDDCSTDATPEIVQRYAAEDARVRFVRNPERVGMVENWRRAYALAAETVPRLEYFAFASDHDVWHPRWLEAMLAELDADPDAVVAFPLWAPIDERGARTDLRARRRWSTAGIRDPARRLDRVAPGRKAPNVVYGLFRASALERCGVYSSVLFPDRLLMAQLAVLGTFRQVEEELWLRRLWPDQRRRPHQRTRLFTDRAPLHTYVPAGIVHAVALLRWLVLQGAARPEIGRLRGFRLFGRYLRRACLYPTLRRETPARKWARRQGKRLRRSTLRDPVAERLGPLRKRARRPARNGLRAARRILARLADRARGAGGQPSQERPSEPSQPTAAPAARGVDEEVHVGLRRVDEAPLAEDVRLRRLGERGP
jgi:glycosyltransferase involved in cell wall biosynthesis